MSQQSEPAPILRVTVGVPVFTADAQKLGKVKDVRGESFQVETGLFQADYWLAGDIVAEAVPEHSVTLGINKQEVDAHRLSSEQAA